MHRRVIHLYLLAVLTIVIAACAEHSGSEVADCANDALKRSLFEKHVVPELNRCTRCHGGSQSPLFRSADSEVAYAAASSPLNGEPSTFEIRAGNGHCGSDCTDNTGVVAAMTAFRDGLGGACSHSTGTFALRSTSASLETIPVNGTPARITVTFPTATGPVATFKMVLEIRRVLEGTTPNGNCTIKQILYNSNDGNVEVAGVQLWPDDEVDDDLRNYIGITGAGRKTTGNVTPVLFGMTQSMECPSTLAVAINAKEVPSFPPTGINEAARAYFIANVMPIIADPARCISCHRTGNRYSFTTADAVPVALSSNAFHQKAMERVYVLVPSASPLLRRPVDLPGQTVLAHGGGKLNAAGLPHLNQTEINLFLNWMNQENAP